MPHCCIRIRRPIPSYSLLLASAIAVAGYGLSGGPVFNGVELRQTYDTSAMVGGDRGCTKVEHARVEGSGVSSLESDAFCVDPALLTVAIFRSSNAMGGAVPSAGPSWGRCASVQGIRACALLIAGLCSPTHPPALPRGE